MCVNGWRCRQVQPGEKRVQERSRSQPGITAEHVAEYYRWRCEVEHDIRDPKATMWQEHPGCRSVDMVKQELLTSVLAYSPVFQFRCPAAEIAKLPPRRLSFTAAFPQTCHAPCFHTVLPSANRRCVEERVSGNATC